MINTIYFINYQYNHFSAKNKEGEKPPEELPIIVRYA